MFQEEAGSVSSRNDSKEEYVEGGDAFVESWNEYVLTNDKTPQSCYDTVLLMQNIR